MLGDYLAHLTAAGLSPLTIKAYGSDLCDFDPTHAGVRAYAAQLARSAYLATTLQRKLCSARTYCRWLEEQGVALGHWPPLLKASPSPERRRPPALAPEAIARLLAAPWGTSPSVIRDRALLRVLAEVGCRASELVDLDAASVDLAAGYVRVGSPHLGTVGYERDVVLSVQAVDALRIYLDDGRPGLDVGTSPALFLNHRGERLTRQGLWLVLKGHARTAGVAVASPNQLRRAAADRLVAADGALSEAQRILGHASVYTTLAYRQTALRRAA